MGGEFGGLVKIEDLITKLNNLESRVNDLASAYQPHTHLSSAPGAPSGPPIVPWTKTPLTNTTKNDLENPDITHG